MGWSVGYDFTWKRDIGYGVPAYCDHPGCMKEIDRGLSYVCGGEPWGGEFGCGLFFCEHHMFLFVGGKAHAKQLCGRCQQKKKGAPFEPTPDHPRWIRHKLKDKSWKEWRDENPEAVAKLKAALKEKA